MSDTQDPVVEAFEAVASGEDETGMGFLATLIQANYNQYAATTQQVIEWKDAEINRLRVQLDYYRPIAEAFMDIQDATHRGRRAMSDTEGVWGDGEV